MYSVRVLPCYIQFTGDSFLGTSVSPAVTPTKKIPPAIEEQPSSLLTRQKDGLELEKSELCEYLRYFEAVR